MYVIKRRNCCVQRTNKGSENWRQGDWWRKSDSDSDNGGNEEQTTTSNFIAEGTVITLSDSINIRSGMSENDSKIGTAFSGEKVTVVMSYAEGWTKVTWNGQTGYIKTSLLQ